MRKPKDEIGFYEKFDWEWRVTVDGERGYWETTEMSGIYFSVAG